MISRSQANRPGHFMPSALLSSQFVTLEPLAPDESEMVLEVDQGVDALVNGYDTQHRLESP